MATLFERARKIIYTRTKGCEELRAFCTNVENNPNFIKYLLSQVEIQKNPLRIDLDNEYNCWIRRTERYRSLIKKKVNPWVCPHEVHMDYKEICKNIQKFLNSHHGAEFRTRYERENPGISGGPFYAMCSIYVV